MRAVGIAQTNHALNLEPGAYYWRVKAVDSFGNESEWANSPSRFQVGTIPLSILIVGAIIYMVILYLLIRAFLRRRNRDTYYYY